MSTDPPAILAAANISKAFGRITAISDVSIAVGAGEVLCLLGDNGAGKSTVIKILSGLLRPDTGTTLVDGVEQDFRSAGEALALGIATVYQDLAVMPLMSITRNFFLGSEPETGRGPFRRLDLRYARDKCRDELARLGITVRDTNQLAGTLSGGEQQALAIARAEHFGGRVLILDEPTSALGVKEAAIVLQQVVATQARGVGVIFVTHNVQHALAVGDRFTFLNHGLVTGTYTRSELTIEDAIRHMSGDIQQHELEATIRHAIGPERGRIA